MGHGFMRTGRASALLGAALLALGAGGSAEAATYNIFVERVTSPFSPPGAPEEEELTFSGSGTVTIDDAAGGPADIDALSLAVQTLAAVDGAPAVLTFEFGLADVAATSGLDAPLAPDLSGVVIELSEGGKASTGGEASFLDGLTLDFTQGLATAFCIGEPDVQCIRGGGSSSGLEAGLSAAIIPLPATLPLLLAGLGALTLRRRPAG